MPRPIKPTVPPAPLRTQSDTFAIRAETMMIFMEVLVRYIDEAVEFIADESGGEGSSDTASAVLAKLLNVDTDTSDLNANFLQGIASDGFLRSGETVTDFDDSSIVSGSHYFPSTVANGPDGVSGDGMILHFASGAPSLETIQIAFFSGAIIYIRHKENRDSSFSPWSEFGISDDDVIELARGVVFTWAQVGSSDKIPLDKFPDSFSSGDGSGDGGTGGGLTTGQVRGLIADWAEQGNDDKIPLIKLTLSSTAEALAGVSLTALMTPLTTRSAMNAFVPPWAQVDNEEEIPASKIGDGTLTAAKFAAGTLLRGQRGLRGPKGDTGDAGSGTGGGLTTTAVRGLIKDFAEVGSSARIASGDIGDDAVIPQKMPLDRQFLLYRASAATLVDLDSKIIDLSIRPNSSGLYTYDSTAENQPDDDTSGGVMLSTRDVDSAGTTTGTGSRQVILTNDNNIYYRTGDAFTSFPRPFVKFTGDTTASQVFAKMEAVLRARADDELGVRIDSITTTSNSWMKRGSTSTQLLTDSFVNVPFQTLESDNSGTDITYLNGKFTAVEAGSYMFGGFISIRDTAGQRAQAEIQYYLDDVAHGQSHLAGYVRNAGGSPKWTIAIPAEPFLLTAGQAIELRIKNASASVSTNVLGTDSEVWFVRMTGDRGLRGLRGLAGEGTATDLTAVNQKASDNTRFINRNRDGLARLVTRADALEAVDQAITTRVDEDRVRLNALETREPEDESLVHELRKIIGGGGVIDMGAVNEFTNGTADRYELENKSATAGYPPQSFCVDPYTDELFTLNRRDTSRSAGTVNVSIFDANGVRKPEAINSTVNLANTGHSHFSISWNREGNRVLWSSAANSDPDKFNYVSSASIALSGGSLSYGSRLLYKLFTGSTDFCLPACSLDGRYLVAAGQKTGSKVDIKVFDLQKLLNNGAGDYSDDHFTSFELSGTFSSTSPLRGLACDGTYIYILAGNASSTVRKKMLVYNMDGVFMHEISDFKVGKSKSLLDSPSTASYAPQGLGWVYYSGKPYLGAVIHSGSSTARKARIWVMGLPYSERSVSKTWEIFDPRMEDGVIWENARANTIQTPNFESGFDYRIDGEMSISASGSIFVEAFYHIQQAWVTVEVLSNVSIVGRVGIHMHWHNPNSDSTIKTGFLEWFQRSELISKNNPSAKRTIAMTSARGSLERINKIRFRVSDDDESFNTGLLHMTRSRVDG